MCNAGVSRSRSESNSFPASAIGSLFLEALSLRCRKNEFPRLSAIVLRFLVSSRYLALMLRALAQLYDTNTHTHTHTHAHTRMRLYVYVYMYIRIYVCIYIYMASLSFSMRERETAPL